MPLQFAHPAILAAGLACIAIPILVHLLTRRRRRTVRWGAMRFLLEAYRRQKRRLRLEQLILLLMRCALVALIGVAVARPFFGPESALGGSRTLILVIDDSLTAGVVDEQGRSTLEDSKSRAIAVVNALSASGGDAVGVITLAGPAQSIVLPPSSDLAGVSRVIENIVQAQSSADWTGAYAQLDSFLSNADLTSTPEVIVLSDMLEGSTPIDRALKPLITPVRMQLQEPRSPGLTNVAIADVQPPRSLLVVSALSPADLASPVRVRLMRSGPGVAEAAISSVSAWLDPVGGQLAPRPIGDTTVRWTSGQSEAEATIMVRPASLDESLSMGTLRVEIDRDALPDDNVARAPIELRQKLSVGIVAPVRFGSDVGVNDFESADWVRLALSPSSDDAGGMQLVTLQPGALDRPRLAGLDAVIVLRPDLLGDSAWGALGAVVREGGIIAIAPPADASLHTWTETLVASFGLPWELAREQQSVEPAMELEPPTDDGAGSVLRVLAGEMSFLARSVHVSRRLRVEAPEVDVLLRTSDEVPFLVLGRPAGSHGAVALFASAIDPAWTDLPTKPMMVPLFQELVRQGVARGSRVVTTAAGQAVDLDAQSAELQPIAGGVSVRVAPGSPVLLRQAGVWRVRDSEGAARRLMVTNPDARGSGTGARSRAQLEEWLSPMFGGQITFAEPEQIPASERAGEASSVDAGRGPGWMFFAAAMVLVMIEMFVARWASHAEVSSSGGAA